MNTLSDNAVKILQRRYLRRNETGRIIETPDQLFNRVARSIAAAELAWGTQEDASKWEEKFYNVLIELLFLPNSPTLMNAGIDGGQLSACFVLPVEDTWNSIFTALKKAALIQQSGGGTGFNFSHLRPKDDPVKTCGGTASGPVSFMKKFDTATEHIKQGGKRRGANMGILNIDHPDIEEFIAAKKENGVLNNFNISVAITDEFMNALDSNAEYALVHPNTKTVVKKVNVKKIWNDIIENSWLTGDPGLIFIDTINNSNPTPVIGKIESTNPCGEVPLLSYEPCNLGSINLSKFIHQNNGSNEIDWLRLEEVIITGTRFLDNVIEVNHYTIPEVNAMALGNRKIGLGVMGWADLLISLEIPYDSETALELAERLMQFIKEKTADTSIALAKERGVFRNWENSIYFPGEPIRNATCNSIAPTGTISIIANTSSSIEPLFALAFQRRHVLNEETLFTINNHFINYLTTHGLYAENILNEVLKEGTASHLKELPTRVKNIFKTALEISPVWHLRHQLAFQKYTDNAVSKTINLPETATITDVEDIYKSAWQNKAKGITIFRYHAKDKQVLYKGIQYGEKSCKVCME